MATKINKTDKTARVVIRSKRILIRTPVSVNTGRNNKRRSTRK